MWVTKGRDSRWPRIRLDFFRCSGNRPLPDNQKNGRAVGYIDDAMIRIERDKMINQVVVGGL